MLKETNKLFKHGICSHCLTDDEASDLNLKILLKLFFHNLNYYNNSDNKIRELFKDYLYDCDESLPRHFNIVFDCQHQHKILTILNHRTNCVIKDIYFDEHYDINETITSL